MITSKVQGHLPPMPLQNLSSAEVTGATSSASHETPRKSLKDWNELPLLALGCARINQTAAAIHMHKSESWVSRALRGLEKLGWSDIGLIKDPAFHAELYRLAAEFQGVAFDGNEQFRKDAELGRKMREVAGLLR